MPARRNWIADHLSDDAAAVCRHQIFKWSFVAKLDSAEWRLSPRDIDRWLGERTSERRPICRRSRRHLALVVRADGTKEVRNPPTLDTMRRAKGTATFVTLTSSSVPSGHLPGLRSRTQQTPGATLHVHKCERLRLPSASGRCGFCEGTFAGTRGSDGDAPISAVLGPGSNDEFG